MKQFLLLVAALAVLLVVVACSPTGGQEPIAAEPTQSNEGQGEMKTLYVGPNWWSAWVLARCSACR